MMILASQSPRRKRLLLDAGFSFISKEANIDECPLDGETGNALARRLAKSKAKAIYKSVSPRELVLAADTVVWLGDAIFGKPQNEADAKRKLQTLSGKTHQVTTAVCIMWNGQIIEFSETSDVTFKTLHEEEVIAYLQTDEPYDKAGGYGIQGHASSFVTSYTGDINTIVGLPVKRLIKELQKIGFELPTG